jgi:hypothetical protein
MFALSPQVLAVLGLLFGLCYWLLKLSLTSALNRSVSKSTETHKADLQRELTEHKTTLEAANQQELEKLRAALSNDNQRDLERLKADLSRQNEEGRHGLQIELLKVQSAHGKKHEIYPALFEKLRMTEGAIAGLRGVRRAPFIRRVRPIGFRSAI